jgi:hypothetical protein
VDASVSAFVEEGSRHLASARLPGRGSAMGRAGTAWLLPHTARLTPAMRGRRSRSPCTADTGRSRRSVRWVGPEAERCAGRRGWRYCLPRERALSTQCRVRGTYRPGYWTPGRGRSVGNSRVVGTRPGSGPGTRLAFWALMIRHATTPAATRPTSHPGPAAGGWRREFRLFCN